MDRAEIHHVHDDGGARRRWRRYATIMAVQSQNPASGVSISVSPEDDNDLFNGTTPFTRTYNR